MHIVFIFFFNDSSTTEIYTLSLHDALPISRGRRSCPSPSREPRACRSCWRTTAPAGPSRCRPWPRRTRSASPAGPSSGRSEEHTSELQSRQYLVCRLLLEKKKTSCHYTAPC